MRFATRSQIEAIFEENYDLWGRPLTPVDYRDYWFSLFLTPWGTSNFRYMALTEEEDGPLLSSLKLYRFEGRLFGESVVIAGIGAVYTPREHRAQGGASLLISEVLDYMQKKRAALALLYTEIGLEFYERLGFIELPALDASGPLAPAPPGRVPDPGEFEIREIRIDDSKILAPYHRRLTAGLPLSIDRSPSYWEFVLYRRRRFWEMAPARTGIPVSLLALRGSEVVAAAFAVASSESLHIQEIGALPGAEAALVAILDRIWSRGIEAGARRWFGRLAPGSASLDPRLSAEERPVGTGQPMAAPLGLPGELAGLAADPAFHLYGLDYI